MFIGGFDGKVSGPRYSKGNFGNGGVLSRIRVLCNNIDGFSDHRGCTEDLSGSHGDQRGVLVHSI